MWPRCSLARTLPSPHQIDLAVRMTEGKGGEDLPSPSSPGDDGEEPNLLGSGWCRFFLQSGILNGTMVHLDVPGNAVVGVAESLRFPSSDDKRGTQVRSHRAGAVAVEAGARTKSPAEPASRPPDPEQGPPEDRARLRGGLAAEAHAAEHGQPPRPTLFWQH